MPQFPQANSLSMPVQGDGMQNEDTEAASLASLESLDSSASEMSNRGNRDIGSEVTTDQIPRQEDERELPNTVKTRSRLSTTVSILSIRVNYFALNPSLIVPGCKRRGLFPSLSLIPEYEDARLYPKKAKFTIVFIVAVCAVIGPMGTSIMMPAIDDVADKLHTTVSTVNISVGIYLFTMGFLPIYWSNYSEAFGRRSIYIVSFMLAICFSIGCALSTNIGMLIVFRTLSGAATASVQSVGAGSIGDMFTPHERGRAMGLYYLGPLGGPLFAPIIGGLLSEYLGWRSTQWFMAIFALVSCSMIIFGLPETLRKEDNREAIRRILLLRQRRRPRDEEEKSSESTEEEPIEQNAKEARDPEDTKETPSKLEANEEEEENRSIRRILSSRSIQSLQRSIHQDEEAEEELFDNTQHGITDNFQPTLSRVHTHQRAKVLGQLRQNDIERLQSKVINDSEKSGDQIKKIRDNIYVFLFKPLKSVIFLRYPPVCLAVLYAGPIFCVTYFLNLTLTYAYSRPPYNFSEVIVGLVYIPNSLGYIVASIFGGRWTDKLLKEYAEKHNGDIAPEARIGVNVWLAAALYPVSLLIFGWCIDEKVHWVAPLVGTAIFGFASMIIIGATVTYLVDSLPGRGATGVALNNLIRMTFATIASFITEPLIDALGIGILFSILAGICAVLAIILLILKKRGDYWRETYDLVALYDMLD